jgi:TorA maturation chaperone TorD
MTSDIQPGDIQPGASPDAKLSARPTVQSTAAELDEGTARAAIELLAHWWSRPVADEVETWAAAAEVEAEVRDRMPGKSGARMVKSGGADLAGLLSDYERLFVGPGPVPCPPYESFWREDVPIDIRRSLMGPCTADLRQLYGALGLEVTPTLGEMPDHVAVELEALAYALSSSATYGPAKALFFDHLRRWLPRLCRAVAHEAETPFYRDLAETTVAWTGPIQSYLDRLDHAGT